MKAGLEDIIAGESRICFIDGDKGILAYQGYNIHELAPNSNFEETCYLLWFGRLPKKAELDDISKKMASSRSTPAASHQRPQSRPEDGPPDGSVAHGHFDAFDV